MDYARLRLKYHGDPARLDEVLQAECRDKCVRKLPTLSTTEGFRFPSTALAEMATSEAIAEIHASTIETSHTVLDMTCGLGIDTFAMARKGADVTAIEIDPKAYKEICHNTEILGLGNRVHTVCADSIEWLRENDRHFDIIFIDPQRRDSTGRHFLLSQCVPDITSSFQLLTSRCERLIIKMSPMADVKAVKQELGLDHCHVRLIGTTRECKEVVIETGTHIDKDTVECITVGRPSLSFIPGQGEISSRYDIPATGDILLEPYPAVMKGVSLGSLRRFTEAKLAPETHLFTAPDGQVSAFPGKKMRIIEVIPFSKSAIKGFARSHPSVNVAVRNFPLTAPELARKLKVREGGDLMVHGATLADGSRVLILTETPH